MLQEIKRLVSSKYIYIEVPFENIMQKPFFEAVSAKKHWHEHINFYSDKSLITVASESGLKYIDTKILKVSEKNSILQFMGKLDD